MQGVSRHTLGFQELAEILGYQNNGMDGKPHEIGVPVKRESLGYHAKRKAVLDRSRYFPKACGGIGKAHFVHLAAIVLLAKGAHGEIDEFILRGEMAELQAPLFRVSFVDLDTLQLAVLKSVVGISETLSARPIQAALASAATFAVGAALPLLTAYLTPLARIPLVVSLTSLVSLALLGAVSAGAGGSPIGKAVVRVTFWGALAMAATAGVGALFGVQA